MSIFTKGLNTDYTLPVVEGYNEDSALQIARESYDDMLQIIESIYNYDMEELTFKRDMKSLEESSADACAIEERTTAYTAAMESWFGDFKKRAKSIFEKLWAKVKAFFKAIVRFFDGFVLSGRDFVKKYRSEIEALEKAGKLKGFKAELYTYTVDGDKVSTAYGKAKDMIWRGYANENADTLKDEKDEMLGKLREALVGDSDKEDYAKKLLATFRDGASEKKEVDVNISEVMNTLENSYKLSESIKKAESDADDMFKKLLRSLDEHKDDEDKKDNDSQVKTIKSLVSIASEMNTVCMTFISAWRNAVKERDSAYKSLCVKAFHHKEEKKETK